MPVRPHGARLLAVAAVFAAAAAASGCGTASAAGPHGSTPIRGPAARLPLSGVAVGIDPGHDGGNFTAASAIGRKVWNGRAWEDCDTTGTATNDGYTEALFNFRVAGYLRADLIRAGARVVETRTANNGVGPCVNRRAQIIDDGHVNVAVDIHADGGPAWGRGFTVLEPIPDGPNDRVIASSARLGADIKTAMLAGTTMPASNYDGKAGVKGRDDLAGLNLTTVPKVLIEVGNMRNAADARLLTSAAFQQQVAGVLVQAITLFLR